MTQAILLGAGRGSRLDPMRGNHPKWMLEVAGLGLAQHLVNALHRCNVTDVLLVRGSLGGAVLTPSVSYRDASIRATCWRRFTAFAARFVMT
jgi:NDP-sugar pyrophosphorylase family protein